MAPPTDISHPAQSPSPLLTPECRQVHMPLLPAPAIAVPPRVESAPPAPVVAHGSATHIRQTQHSSIAKSVMSHPHPLPRDQAGHVPTINVTTAPTPAGMTSIPISRSTDTPAATAPNSPRIRATTIDVPGLTSSRVSPDGRISNRDIGAKLVIVMVGLPARGKSYVTKKLARYLNWLQHDTKIFNVGNRRRIAASALDHLDNGDEHDDPPSPGTNAGTGLLSAETIAALNAHANGESPKSPKSPRTHRRNASIDGGIDQSAAFFDPSNKAASDLREKVALETLDELLHYILHEGGSVGILDATNSTRKRRKAVIDRVRQVAGKELGVVFLESECTDQKLLEANMRLKLQGPDYRDTDPAVALEDFKKRVNMYENSYVPLGDYEEKQNMAYIKMIDVGRKVVSHQIRGFLAAQTVYFLLNFHLSPRQIWITRHGESTDNVAGKIGGDASLSPAGEAYASALTSFIDYQRKHFHEKQLAKHNTSHLPPRPGDTTPPNPEYTNCCSEDEDGRPLEKNFCVWTSMLKRSIETAAKFDEEVYDVKQMRMLDELNAGIAEGMTYDEIRNKWPEEFLQRKNDKLRYRYPGAGGESYLDVINRLRAVIVEVERMQDHVLLVAHRVVARVLLAYFLGLQREDVANLDVPLGMLYMLEPKPYGVEFKAFQYNPKTHWFDHMENFQLQNDQRQSVKITR